MEGDSVFTLICKQRKCCWTEQFSCLLAQGVGKVAAEQMHQLFCAVIRSDLGTQRRYFTIHRLRENDAVKGRFICSFYHFWVQIGQKQRYEPGLPFWAEYLSLNPSCYVYVLLKRKAATFILCWIDLRPIEAELLRPNNFRLQNINPLGSRRDVLLSAAWLRLEPIEIQGSNQLTSNQTHQLI